MIDNRPRRRADTGSPGQFPRSSNVSVHVSHPNRPASSGAPPTPTKDVLKDMVWIPGRTFQMGSDGHYPEEAPAHPVTVSGF